MADALTFDEYDILRTCIRADLMHSRAAALAILESHIAHMGKNDRMRQTMGSLAGKLGRMGDAEFRAIDL